MQIALRLFLALAALVAGNMLIPDGGAVDALSAQDQGSDLRLFGGTALIILGAVVFARALVNAINARSLDKP